MQPPADGQQCARNLCARCADEQRAAASDRPFAGVFGTMFGYMKAVILSAPTPSRKVQAPKSWSAASRDHSPAEIMPAATRWAFGLSEPASRYFPRVQPACTSSIRLLQRPSPTPIAQYHAQPISSAFGRPSPLYSARSTYSASYDRGSTSSSSSFGWPRPNDPLFFHVKMAQSSVRLHRGGEVWAAERPNRRIGERRRTHHPVR
jgi:hypothetical protein